LLAGQCDRRAAGASLVSDGVIGKFHDAAFGNLPNPTATTGISTRPERSCERTSPGNGPYTQAGVNRLPLWPPRAADQRFDHGLASRIISLFDDVRLADSSRREPMGSAQEFDHARMNILAWVPNMYELLLLLASHSCSSAGSSPSWVSRWVRASSSSRRAQGVEDDRPDAGERSVPDAPPPPGRTTRPRAAQEQLDLQGLILHAVIGDLDPLEVSRTIACARLSPAVTLTVGHNPLGVPFSHR